MTALFSVLLRFFPFSHPDGGGIGAVAQAQPRGQHEQGLDAQGVPDPAAEQGDEDGDDMVDGQAGGDGGLHLVGAVRQVLHIDVGCHGGQGDHRIQHIVDAAHQKGRLHGEQVVGEAVEKAHHHQDEGVRHHHRLVAHLVDDAPHHRRQQKAGHRAYRMEQADRRGPGAVKQDEHIGAKGEKHLLPRAVKHLQHIIFGVFFVEIKAALGFIGLAFAPDAHGAHHADPRQHSGQGEKQAVGLLFRKPGEHQHDHQIPRQSADLVGGAEQAQGRAPAARPGIFQGEGVFHAQLDVLAQGIHTDGQGGQHLCGRQDGVHGQTRQHDDGAGLVQALRRQHIKGRQQKHQQNAGQLPEKFGDAAPHFAHAHHLGQKVVQHPLVQAVGQAGDENGQQKHLEAGVLPKYGFDLFHGFHAHFSLFWNKGPVTCRPCAGRTRR